MPVQTTYAAEHEAAYEGQRANLSLINIMSKVAEGSDINFGRAVIRGTADNQAKLPSAAGQEFIGVTELTTAWSVNESDVHLYSEYREMNIIDFGEMWVQTEEAVDPGDPVRFNFSITGGGVIGRFRSSDDGYCDLIDGATFETTAAADTLVKIKLPSPGIAGSTGLAMTASGAINPEISVVTFDTTGGAIAASLADGVAGQIIALKMITDGGTDAVLTPANFADGTDLTFDDANDSALIGFDGATWGVIGTPTATVG